MTLTTKEQIAEVRRMLRKLVPGVSVRNGRGTAHGWIEISGSGDYGEFTEEQATKLRELGLGCGGNIALISREDRSYWLHVLEERTR